MDDIKNKYDEQTITNISPSTYNAEEDMLEIVEKYFDIEDTNLLKTGFLGSLIEMNAHIFKHSIYHKNFLYDEFFPNTAKLPSSVYNFARNTNYRIATATPAKMSVVFAISKKDVIDLSTIKKDGTREFTISKDDIFTIRDFNYLLSHDVKIIAKSSDEYSDYAITAFYDLENSHKFPFAKLESPYIKTWIESIDSLDYILLNIDIWQVRKESREFRVLSRDISDVLSYIVSHEDQLSHFNTYYRYPLSKPRRELPVYFNNIFTPEDVKEFAYYNFNSDDELKIYFSGLPKTFIPDFNSEITVDYFTTRGSEANFRYKSTAEIGFRFNDNRLSNIPTIIKSISDSAGGRDKETLKEVKKSVIRELFHRNNLATDKDLNNFFKNVIDSRSVNGSTISFFKKRDDVIRRIYGAYLLMKNSTGLTVPTNTIDLEIDGKEIQSLNNRLETGSVVVFDPNSRKYRLLRSDETIESYLKSNRGIVYSIPFLIRTHMDPVPRVSYYNNSIDRNIPLAFKRVNLKSKKEYIINNVEIKRNSMMGEQYEFTVNINTNMSSREMNENVKLIGTLSNSNGRIYGYVDFHLHEEIGSAPIQYVYKARLLTYDKFDKYGRLEIVNTLKDLITGDTKSKVAIDEDLNLTLSLMYSKLNDKEKFDEFKNMGKFKDYTSLFTVKTTDTFTLSRNLDGILHSDMEINTRGVLRLRNVPVVASKYFTKLVNFKEFYQILDNYFDVIYNSLDNLQNNTSVDIKFYNTYGLSELYTIDTVNLSLELNISLYSDTYIEHIDKSIKDIIIKLVEESDNLFAISELTSVLQNEVKEINYIEFESLNGMNVQKIERLKDTLVLDDMTRDEVLRFTPEYLNISHDFSDEDYSESVPNIKINYI